MVVDWPLTGRAGHFQAVNDALDDGPGGIVIAGQPGVGKTRLAREVLAARGAGGDATRWVSAAAAEQAIPLGAFSDVLQSPAASAAGTIGVLHDAAAQLAASSEGRLVLGVDDAHLLDPVSAALVHHLAQEGSVALVVTIRSAVAAPDAVVSLWKERRYPRLELEPLSRDETFALIESALGGPVERSSLERLWRLSRGNPLFLRELMDSGARTKRLAHRHGAWTWQSESTGEPALLEVVSERIAATDEDARDVLEFLALAEPLALDVVTALVPVASVEAAERAGAVSVELAGHRRMLRLAHPLYADAVRAAMTPEARTARCADLAAALAREPHRAPADTVRLALMTLEAGNVENAALFGSAAGYAAASLDHPLAERLARASVAADDQPEARFLLANAMLWQGRLAEADDELAQIETMQLSDRDRVRVAAQRAGLLFWSLDRAVDAEAVLRRAEHTVRDDAARLDLIGQRSCFLTFRGQVADGADAAASVLESDGAGPVAVVWAAMGGTLALALIGRCFDAVAAAEHGRDALAASPSDMAPMRGALADGECTALRLGGLVPEAARRANDVIEWAVAEANPLLTAAGALLAAQTELARGALLAATRLFDEAVAGMAEFDPGGWLFHGHLGLAEVAALRGDAATARAHLDAASTLRPMVLEVFRPKELLVAAWVEVADGELERAREKAWAAAEEARAMGLWAVEVGALHTALRHTSSLEGTDRLSSIARTIDNPLASACATHAEALRNADGDALEQIGERFEAMELLLVAADAHADAARTLAGTSKRRAIRAASRARALIHRCAAAPTPAVALLPPAPSLTPRERQIAGFAAEGMTSTAIAEELVVSVRTVHNHLQRVYDKLGISSRSELADVLPPAARD